MPRTQLPDMPPTWREQRTQPPTPHQPLTPRQRQPSPLSHSQDGGVHAVSSIPHRTRGTSSQEPANSWPRVGRGVSVHHSQVTQGEGTHTPCVTQLPWEQAQQGPDRTRSPVTSQAARTWNKTGGRTSSGCETGTHSDACPHGHRSAETRSAPQPVGHMHDREGSVRTAQKLSRLHTYVQLLV